MGAWNRLFAKRNVAAADAPLQAPGPGARVIRVFVSSTFRDMMAERDHLVKVIFPQLRRLCESRGVTWSEVDLRWGVTDEAVAEGKVLPICLEEIHRCRPYFIGLLGERYGWVPESIPRELLEREEWLREQLAAGKSVTELEILHGVLRNPAMAGHAFFYFRDPAYVDTVPEERRADVVSESPAGAGKLRMLKEAIRRSGLPVREDYADAEALGALVLADMTAVIDACYPEGSQPDPLDREAAEHDAFARSRTYTYLGRPAYYAALDAHAAGEGPPLAVLGVSGSGKSALLANWAFRYRAAHPDAVVLMHFTGASAYSTDWAAMVRRLMGEFKRRFGIEQEIPDQPEALRSAFPNWLAMAAARGRLVLVIDGLNQLEDHGGAPDLLWLPPVLPANVRLVVSTLPGRPLDAIEARNWDTLLVEPLTVDERVELITADLGRHAKALNTAQTARLAAAEPCQTPLFLKVLLDELRQFGSYAGLDARIDHYLQAGDAFELFGRVIARWEEDFGGDTALVGDALSLLWAARRGLSEAEVLEALGNAAGPFPRARWSPLFLAMGDALVTHSGRLTFAHDYLRQAAEAAYLPTPAHQQRAHLRLADYFTHQPDGPRRTDELPWQLAAAAAWQRLHDLLADRAFFIAAWESDQFEVKARWAQVEAGSPLRLVDAYRAQLAQPEAEADKNYLWYLGHLLDDTGHPAEALRLHAALTACFRDNGNLHGLQASLGSQAAILQVRGELERAMALHQEQERLCQQLGHLDGLQRSLGDQAVILYARGELDGAMALLKEQERICRQLGHLHGLSISLGNQALILQDRGELDRAMALHQEQERLCRQLGHLHVLQASLGSQAAILHARGELDRAMALHQEQERLCRQLGHLHGLQASLGSQAVILYARGELDGAMALHQEQERLCRQLGNLDGLQTSLGNQALILQDRGELDRAMALLKEQERLCRQLGSLDGLSISLDNQALILQDRGELDRAMALLKEQERLCRQLGSLDGLSISLGNQALILRDRGELDGAMALLKEQERLCRQLGHLDGLQASLGSQAAILQDRGELDRAMALHQEQERLCRQLGRLDGLQTSLGNQALILQDRGELERAMALLKEEERLCRQLGYLDGLQASLGNQAVILQDRGELDRAMALHQEQERLCRQLGRVDALAISLANQASVLKDMGRARQGLPLAEEAYQLAAAHGYGPLAKQIEPLLDAVRKATQGE